MLVTGLLLLELERREQFFFWNLKAVVAAWVYLFIFFVRVASLLSHPLYFSCIWVTLKKINKIKYAEAWQLPVAKRRPRFVFPTGNLCYFNQIHCGGKALTHWPQWVSLSPALNYVFRGSFLFSCMRVTHICSQFSEKEGSYISAILVFMQKDSSHGGWQLKC